MKMSVNFNKIFSLLFSLMLIGFISYLTFFVNTGYKKNMPKQILVEGNNLLGQDEYLVYTKLQTNVDFKKMEQSVIKDRFEKHPYIRRADVEISGKDIIKVNTREKVIKALILINSEPYLISSEYQLLPLIAGINSIDVPVISSIKADGNLKVLSYIKNEDIKQAFRIIDAMQALNNPRILENLSEINFSSGAGPVYQNEVVINFSGLEPAVIFGRGEEGRKMVCLETLWDKMVNGQISLAGSGYVDLRYTDNIYIGNKINTGVIQ